MYRFLVISFFTLHLSIVACGQNSGVIEGKISDSNREPLPGITVMIQGTTKGAVSNAGGYFRIDQLAIQRYKLLISGLGFEEILLDVDLSKKLSPLEITMKQGSVTMADVVITGQSESELKKQGGFELQVIEAKQFRNFTADVNQVIKQTPGVNIREAGGLGSGFSISLNGLSGNQVRYFIDGIPMENFGSALTLNNFPVSLISEIEIYKGVVPVELGADALGGAINIITGNIKRSFLEADYSFGSFNTHRASVTGQQVLNNNLYFSLRGFYNYSDNNYWMDEVPLADQNGNIIDPDFRTRRFHDAYESGMLAATIGLFNKKIADDWKVTVTYGANDKEFQHPDFNIKRVFGQFSTNEETIIASTDYRKKTGKFDIRAYLLTGRSIEQIIDTSTFRYNWAGDTTNRLALDPDDPKGELNERRSLFELTDELISGRINISYEVDEQSTIDLSATSNYLRRRGEDFVDELNNSFRSPNFIRKNIGGASYNLTGKSQRLRLSAFGKYYSYSGKIIVQDFENNDVETNVSFDRLGYGLTSSYSFKEELAGIKASAEKAYRIPEPTEVLGSGLYILPNPDLRPETSYNFNFGGWYKWSFGNFKADAEWNLFVRSSKDFIQPPRQEGPFGIFDNIANVRSEGLELGVKIDYQKIVSWNINGTYQNITDRNPFDEGLVNNNYRSRIPNTPYFFWNSLLRVKPVSVDDDRDMVVSLNTRYVHKFFLKWENLGNAADKNIIPSQLTFDLIAEYSLNHGKYNFSVTASNLTNAQVFDNFLIQKPGRAFYGKVRILLNRN